MVEASFLLLKKWMPSNSSLYKIQTLDWSRHFVIDFREIATCFIPCFESDCATDVKINGSVASENSYFKMQRLPFSSKLDWVTFVASIAKSTSKKIGTLSLFLRLCFISTIQAGIEYYCYVWGGAPNWDMLINHQK